MCCDTKQDKVNYAVSEREDRVTGATTLTRMAGYICAVLSCTRLYWALLGCSELYGAVLSYVRKYWAVLDCTGL